jgi:hypothetical protein
VTRRPRRNRPPRLDDVFSGACAEPAPPAEPGVVGARRSLVQSKVTGAHHRLGCEAVRHAIRRLTWQDRAAGLGLDLGECGADEATAALEKTHGWDPATARTAIDPDATLAALRAATIRVRHAAAAGARIAIATSRPASLLGLGLWIASDLAERGATLLSDHVASTDAPGRRELWWIGDVAVVTDGQSVLAHDAPDVGDDWLFAIGRPDLVVADRSFAGAAVRAGVETIAWADLDAPALSVAAIRGRPLLVVPMAEQRPAWAYDAVIGVIDEPEPERALPPVRT